MRQQHHAQNADGYASHRGLLVKTHLGRRNGVRIKSVRCYPTTFRRSPSRFRRKLQNRQRRAAMKSSSLQARDPRLSEERSGTGKRGEIRKLSADGEVSVESSVQPHEQRRLPRSRIQGMGSTELKWARWFGGCSHQRCISPRPHRRMGEREKFFQKATHFFPSPG